MGTSFTLAFVYGIVLIILCSSWGEKDAVENYTPKKWRKIIGYILLAIGFVSFIGVIWFVVSTVPNLCQASYQINIESIVLGQMEIVMTILCWGWYAIIYKYSNIKTWKKVVKVIGYILITITLISITNDMLPGFDIIFDIFYAPNQFFIKFVPDVVLLLISIVLIRLSRTRKRKTNNIPREIFMTETAEDVEL